MELREMGVLDDRMIVVTGAGRGIGAGIAKLCAAEGAQVVVNDPGVDVHGDGGDKGPAEQVVSEITAAGGVAIPHLADVSKLDQAEDLVNTCIGEFGRLDVLINVAGILRDKMLFNMEPEEWDAVLAVHLRGTFNTSRIAARHWRSEQRGNYRLINTTSGAGYFGAPGQPNYAAAKMGIIGFTYSCAWALMKYGVTANALSPGGNTRMNGDLDWSRMSTDPNAGNRRVSPPENAAPAVVYVASTKSNWFTGQVFASAGQSIKLLNRPQFVRELVTTDDIWSVPDVFEKFEESFRPACEGLDNRYEAVARQTVARQEAEKAKAGS
jgi:NAD(P)-dependent dehydrogenase (short-subunit alcohol dehydrogenase family)